MQATLRRNDTGPRVRAARLLVGAGGGEAFDAALEARVRAWQASRGLAADGVIGPKTWTAIAKAAPTCSTSKNRVSDAAQALQLLLDGADLAPDGVFGPRTKKAVAAFQASAGLSADGVCGPKTWAALIVGTLPSAGAFRQPVDYKQGDSRWGRRMYSSHGDKSQTMASSGCGPTAMADAAATLIDPAVTPWTLAELALAWGDRTYNSGTATSFFRHIQEKYGFSKLVSSTGLAAVKACLDAGGYVICRMGPGYWTKGGHYICAWKYDDSYIYCNDPASSSRKRQKLADFAKQRKDFWCFHR